MLEGWTQVGPPNDLRQRGAGGEAPVAQLQIGRRTARRMTATNGVAPGFGTATELGRLRQNACAAKRHHVLAG